ncbi:MAG: hypothetical protein RLZZ479_910 [Bacteroidota bacterium]
MKDLLLISLLFSFSSVYAQTENPLHPQCEEDETKLHELVRVIDNINYDRVMQAHTIDSLSEEYRITLLELNQKKIENELYRERVKNFHDEEILLAKNGVLAHENKIYKRRFYTAATVAIGSIGALLALIF